MKRHDRLGAQPARDRAGLVRGQVILARRMLGILGQENAFDEHPVHAGEQLQQRLQVRLGVAKVSDVADALPGNDLEHEVTQLADRPGHGVRPGPVAPLRTSFIFLNEGMSTVATAIAVGQAFVPP